MIGVFVVVLLVAAIVSLEPYTSAYRGETDQQKLERREREKRENAIDSVNAHYDRMPVDFGAWKQWNGTHTHWWN